MLTHSDLHDKKIAYLDAVVAGIITLFAIFRDLSRGLQGNCTKIKSPPQRRQGNTKKSEETENNLYAFAFLCENFAFLASLRWVFRFDAIALPL